MNTEFMKNSKRNIYAIEDILPHDHPMILIDKLVSYTQTQAHCQVTITERSNFYRQDSKSVPNYIVIEYMAQAIAALSNAKEKDLGCGVDIGFLVSSRKLKLFTGEFKLGVTLDIHIDQIYHESQGLATFDCSAYNGDELVASGKINIYLPENPEEFLAQQ